jgi:carbamoyl-phosphate synthase large subunit
MKIVINKEDLEAHVVDLLQKIPNNKLLLDHYLDGAIECEADAICDGDEVYIIGIMEHIEPCGIHSGDSNATLLYLIWVNLCSSKLKITQKI